MSNRFSLRFDTGERRGEVVPLASRTFSVGRRPGNSLQILENSVSQRHAELVCDEEGVLVRDLGSTNGTRVDGEKVTEKRATHGSDVTFGHVNLVLIDAEGAPLPEPDVARVPRSDSPAGFDVATTQVHDTVGADFAVSAEKLERARAGSRLPLGLFGLVVLAAGAGTAFWYFRVHAPAGGGQRLRPVEPVAQNLLDAGFSFEDGGDAWTPLEEAPAAFDVEAAARYAGETGLAADLGPGEWAAHYSQAAPVGEGRTLTVGARLSVTGDAFARLGVEFAASTAVDPPAPVIAWAAELGATGGFETTELALTIPRGYDRARALLVARSPGTAEDSEGGGAVLGDDVWMVPGGPGTPDATVDEYKFFGLGQPKQVGVLFKVDRVLLSGLAFLPPGTASSESAQVRACSAMSAAATEAGLKVSSTGGAELVLRAESALAGGGVGTIGDGGYAAYGIDFEREAVSDLVLGSGLDLLRLRFSPPAKVRGRREGAAVRFHVALNGGTSVELQSRFRQEREQAATLAAAAESAERAGDLGGSLARWQELLDTYPYEQELVERAEEVRGRLVLVGREDLREISAELERARFFRLVDLFRQCRTSTEVLAQRFAGSEVQLESQKLMVEIDGELAELEADLDRLEIQRLRGVLAVLEAEGSAELAGEVRSYLERFEGGQ